MAVQYSWSFVGQEGGSRNGCGSSELVPCLRREASKIEAPADIDPQPQSIPSPYDAEEEAYVSSAFLIRAAGTERRSASNRPRAAIPLREVFKFKTLLGIFHFDGWDRERQPHALCPLVVSGGKAHHHFRLLCARTVQPKYGCCDTH